MKEPYGEGLASHSGPESCAAGSNRRGEALTGEVRAGDRAAKSAQVSGCRHGRAQWQATHCVACSRASQWPGAVRESVHVPKLLSAHREIP